MPLESTPGSREQIHAIGVADVPDASQEPVQPPFFLPDQVDDNPDLAAGLLRVVDDLSAVSERRAFIAKLTTDAVFRNTVRNPLKAAKTARANQVAYTTAAWDRFMTLGGYPEFVGLRGDDPAVNGTRAHGLWAQFLRSYTGPQKEQERTRYTRALDSIAAAAIAGAREDEAGAA